MRLAVCYQNVDPRLGGAETFVVDLCRGLIQNGHDVDLLAERWEPSALPQGVQCVPIETHGRSRLARILDFAYRCEIALGDPNISFDCSIGFINTWGQDILIPQGGVRAASLDANSQRFPAGLVRSAYRLGKQINPRWRLYQGIEQRQYDPSRHTRFVAVSRMVRDHMILHHKLNSQRIRVIPNAIDETRLTAVDSASLRRNFRTPLNLPDPLTPVGLFVAHNFKLKGLEPLLRALALRTRRTESAPPIHLAVCGGGKPAPFRHLARSLGIEEFVHFLGFLPDVRAGYHGADFLVLPSYYDPCSLVVFEALACGLPVITTRQNGAGELIVPGRHGFVIERPDAIGALADALDPLADPSRLLDMSNHARALGRQQTFAAYLRSLLALIEEVAADKRRHPNSRGPHNRSIARQPNTPGRA